MRKIINDPKQVAAETLEAFVDVFSDRYALVPDVKGVRVKDPKDKTALVIGGGSGHEPMFGMFVGDGLADAAACGNIFASPDPNTIIKTALSVECGKGVLFVYGNYAGDNLNFDLAAEMLEDMGIASRTVRVWDDVASAPKERLTDRRGIAGDVFVLKIAGAAAGAGLNLEQAYRVTAKARDNTFSLGVALSGATIPGEEKASFTLPEGEMEFGMGIHGEPGVKRVQLQSADEIAQTLVDMILEDSGIAAGDEVCVLVNGLGATTLSELFILHKKVRSILEEKGVRIHDMDVNSYVTSQEMAGASISLLKLDEELKKYYNTPCESPYYRKEGR